jgi:hypothetical protein
MTAAVPSFDIVAVPSVLVDRRALSQAWYDALHLAERGSRAPAGVRSHPLALKPSPGRSVAIVEDASRKPAPANWAPPRASRAVTPEFPVALRGRDRRAAPSPLARRIVARLRATPPSSNATSFSLTTPRGRIHVCVRRLGSGMRLFALCSPALRAEVEAAVAQARFILAGRGVAVV